MNIYPFNFLFWQLLPKNEDCINSFKLYLIKYVWIILLELFDLIERAEKNKLKEIAPKLNCRSSDQLKITNEEISKPNLNLV